MTLMTLRALHGNPIPWSKAIEHLRAAVAKLPSPLDGSKAERDAYYRLANDRASLFTKIVTELAKDQPADVRWFLECWVQENATSDGILACEKWVTQQPKEHETQN